MFSGPRRSLYKQSGHVAGPWRLQRAAPVVTEAAVVVAAVSKGCLQLANRPLPANQQRAAWNSTANQQRS